MEKLWIAENEITEINGLSRLGRLKELFLYSNHISRIENLEELTNLEVWTVLICCWVNEGVTERGSTQHRGKLCWQWVRNKECQ